VNKQVDPSVVELLFVVVNYQSEDDLTGFLGRFEERPGLIRFAIADNSPEHSSPELAELIAARSDVATFATYPDNPGYFGASSRLLRALEGQIEVGGAVVITNIDLEFETDELLAYVAKHRERDPESRWILSPDIVEDGLKMHLNPHRLDPSISPQQHLNRRLYKSDFWYGAIRTLRLLKLRFVSNEQSVSAAAGTTVSSTYGAMFILGPGFFAVGGHIPEMPLFGEEYAIARQAAELNVPIVFDPSLCVRHAKSRSTGLLSAGQRRARTVRSWQEYSKWQPELAYGSMSWLVPS